MNIDLETLQSAVEKEDMLVKVSDAREYFGGCIPGWKEFSDQHGFDWKETMRRGIPASGLLETEDSMALSLVTYVYLREGRL